MFAVHCGTLCSMVTWHHIGVLGLSRGHKKRKKILFFSLQDHQILKSGCFSGHNGIHCFIYELIFGVRGNPFHFFFVQCVSFLAEHDGEVCWKSGAIKPKYRRVLYVWQECSEAVLNLELALFVGLDTARPMAADAAEVPVGMSVCSACHMLLRWFESACMFTQQGVNVIQVNQCLSSHVSREKYVSVSTPLCFAIISSLSPNTHRNTHTMCPESAFIQPLLVNIPTSWLV